MYGNVIGINTAIISPTGGSIGIGFAIPALLAQNVVDQLRQYGETRRGWLGIRLQEVTDEIAEGLGLPNARGALVMGITRRARRQRPDRDRRCRHPFDGREIATSRDLPRIVAETEIGKTVTLDILRKESLDAPAKPVSVKVTLGRLEDADETDTGEDDTPTDADAAAPPRRPRRTPRSAFSCRTPATS